MGAVLKGRDPDLGRDLAVKVLLDAHRKRPELVRRFIEEAQIAGQLQHPGVVPVYELGCFADARPYFTMKLVKGRTLAQLLADRASPAAERSRFVGIFEQVAQTMAYAHARGVIHRDLKPSNVMVGSFGEVLVLDWGIARVTRDPEADGRAGAAPEAPAEAPSRNTDAPDTAPGTVLGTPGFMAPEQAQGWHHLVDARTDVYALGAILRALVQPEPAAGRVPRALVSIWSRAMAAEPDRRYESAAALAADVARYLDGEPVQAHRESAAERAGRFFRKYQTAIVLVLTYLLIRFLFLAARGL
jgi:serine/threonine-protein kinase